MYKSFSPVLFFKPISSFSHSAPPLQDLKQVARKGHQHTHTWVSMNHTIYAWTYLYLVLCGHCPISWSQHRFSWTVVAFTISRIWPLDQNSFACVWKTASWPPRHCSAHKSTFCGSCHCWDEGQSEKWRWGTTCLDWQEIRGLTSDACNQHVSRELTSMDSSPADLYTPPSAGQHTTLPEGTTLFCRPVATFRHWPQHSVQHNSSLYALLQQ